jgi:hypothetical protein
VAYIYEAQRGRSNKQQAIRLATASHLRDQKASYPSVPIWRSYLRDERKDKSKEDDVVMLMLRKGDDEDARR